MKEYLESFIRRSQPLLNLDQLIEETSQEFQRLWDANDVSGWVRNTARDLSLFCIYCKPIRDTHTKVMELI
jgi:hypothetical protein